MFSQAYGDNRKVCRKPADKQALLAERLQTDADDTHVKPEAENRESAVQRNLILLTNTFNYIQSFISLPLKYTAGMAPFSCVAIQYLNNFPA